jgi:hypothetical protein
MGARGEGHFLAKRASGRGAAAPSRIKLQLSWPEATLIAGRALATVIVAPPRPEWEVEFGARYWVSSGRTKYDLFVDPPGTTLLPISRLTYSDLTGHSGELFGRKAMG